MIALVRHWLTRRRARKLQRIASRLLVEYRCIQAVHQPPGMSVQTFHRLHPTAAQIAVVFNLLLPEVNRLHPDLEQSPLPMTSATESPR